jgi:Type ISP C-terminal specificity domain
MSDRDRKRLREIHTFPALVKYLREDLGWPVEQANFADLDEITFDWEADELGIDPDQAAKIEYIKQLRPLENGEPQGVFFVKFNAKSLPVVALRRLLSRLVIKKRATATAAERPLWAMRDLVFISSYGSNEERQLSFAYFQESDHKTELPTLKVLGWDDRDTALHLDRVHDLLTSHLTWPANHRLLPIWRKDWSKAFELRHGQVVSTAKELAEQLATLARGIRERANQLLRLETENGPLRALMTAFKGALIHDLTEDQFADMYAQTIAYGLLSARITHPDPVQAETLPDLIPVTNPFLKELMETFVLAGGKRRGRKKGLHLDFDELGINDVVDLLRRANMDAILRNFGAAERREDPVTYFYEDFLDAYDSQERKRRGVYYTPKPVVSYIVRRVHELLQRDFGIEDGLASTITWAEMVNRRDGLTTPHGVAPNSPFVQILDPATGTATFLVTVVEVIHEALRARWTREALSDSEQRTAWNEYVPKQLLPRLYGYELMMAPYAIAHLKIGLKLFETGYEFGSDERAQVFLTNALELASDASYSQIDALSNALARESRAVNVVKSTRCFTVVIGNPPYSGHSANNQVAWIVDKVHDYKRGLPDLQKPAQGKWLQDDYVKFIRLAEQLVSGSGSGVIGVITNHSYLTNPTFRGMRRHLLLSFDRLRVIDLHGNTKREERNAAAQEKDENVFDIQQGVAILLGARIRGNGAASVDHIDVWGSRASKYTGLARASLASPCAAVPSDPLWLFVPRDESLLPEYERGIRIPDLFSLAGDPAPGVVTTHDEFAIAFSPDEIRANVEELLASSTEAAARQRFRLCSQSQWEYGRAKRILKTGAWKEQILPILYRPFDVRFTINDPNVAVHRRERVLRHILGTRNIALLTDRQVGSEFSHVFCSRIMANDCALSTASRERTYVLPLYVVRDDDSLALEDRVYPNLQPDRLDTLSRGYELPLYAVRDNDSLALERRVYPNLQPERLDALSRGVEGSGSSKRLDQESIKPEAVFGYIYSILHSVSYRRRYSQFLKSDFPRVPIPGSAKIFWDLAKLGNELVELHLLESSKLSNLITTYTGPKLPEISRVAWSLGTVWLDTRTAKKGMDAGVGTIGFHGVSEAVWNFHIGGYQVCEKWLKDRKGRRLSKNDVEHYQRIIVALSETIRIMKEIDEVIGRHGGWPAAFQAGHQAPT